MDWPRYSVITLTLLTLLHLWLDSDIPTLLQHYAPRYGLAQIFHNHSDILAPGMAGLSRLCHQGVLRGTGLPWILQSLNGKRSAKVKVSGQPKFSFISFIGILLVQEEDKNGEISLKDYKEGQVQQLDMEEVGNPILIKHFLF